MPWKVEGVMDLRIEFVLLASRSCKPFSRVCEEFGISRPTGYMWLNRYWTTGTVTELRELSRRPHHSPNKTPDDLEVLVVELREIYGWGARKLKILLAKRGHHLPEATINRILRRRGLIDLGKSSKKSTKRFERATCNELLQLDFKGEYAIREGKCYPLSLLDDHSRYLVGLWVLPSQDTATVKQALESVFRKNGIPQSLLMDHGTPWWSTTNGHGLTRLSVWLLKQDIGLIYSGIRHPQTQGKVERFHKTLKERTSHEGNPETLYAWHKWAARFTEEYNQQRPHEAIGLRTPVEVYRRENLRPYVDKPTEWDYGDAHTLVLNTQGCIDYRGRRCFVCEALAGERVRVDELDNLLIVTFRDTTVREIDIRTGKTRAVVLPARTGEQKCKECPDTTL